MTRLSDPAHFILDTSTGRYLPANKVATTLAAQMSRMWLTSGHLDNLKSQGWRCTYPNGEPIITGVTA